MYGHQTRSRSRQASPAYSDGLSDKPPSITSSTARRRGRATSPDIGDRPTMPSAKVTTAYGTSPPPEVPPTLEELELRQQAARSIESGIVRAESEVGSQFGRKRRLASVPEEIEAARPEVNASGNLFTLNRFSGNEDLPASQTETPESQRAGTQAIIESRGSPSLAAWLRTLLLCGSLLCIAWVGWTRGSEISRYCFDMHTPPPPPPPPSVVRINPQLEPRELHDRILHLENKQKLRPSYKVNYFAPSSGALVNGDLTSPTRRLGRTLFDMVTAYRNGEIVPYVEGYPPKAALGPWDDVGDCWCTPPSDSGSSGQAQLGIILPREIIPTNLIVEHIPWLATSDTTTAPKDIELWVLVREDSKREQIANAAYEKFRPGNVHGAEEFHKNVGLNNVGSAETRSWWLTDWFSKEDPFKATAARYVRIGKGTFDYTRHHIQDIRIDIDLQEFGVMAREVVVRSTSNWGGGKDHYTCFYRLKLHGDTREHRDLMDRLKYSKYEEH